MDEAIGSGFSRCPDMLSKVLKCFLGIFLATCLTSVGSAQHVWVFGEVGHMRILSPGGTGLNGVAAGLRFPVGHYLLDFRGSVFRKGRPEKGYRASHVCASLMFARSLPINDQWAIDLGVEGGYAFREVYIDLGDLDGWNAKQLITAGPAISIRHSGSHWIQPYFTVLPAYEMVIKGGWVTRTWENTPVDPGWTLLFRAGVSMSLPSPG